MNRDDYLTITVEKAPHDCISLRTPEKFRDDLLRILPREIRHILIGTKKEHDDILLILSCSEDEYFARLA